MPLLLPTAILLTNIPIPELPLNRKSAQLLWDQAPMLTSWAPEPISMAIMLLACLTLLLMVTILPQPVFLISAAFPSGPLPVFPISHMFRLVTILLMEVMILYR